MDPYAFTFDPDLLREERFLFAGYEIATEYARYLIQALERSFASMNGIPALSLERD